jgi:lipid A 4'-phosphatase
MTRSVAIFCAAFLAVMGTLVLFPGIDVTVSGWFFTPDVGFSQSAILEAVHEDLRYFVIAVVVTAGAAAVFWPSRRRAAIFLLLALVLGPGLVVNTMFKDHWGRARPVQTVDFGGTKQLTPAFVPANQCPTNCSFPAGDPAVGFFLVAPALLVSGIAARRWAVAGAVAVGVALGIVRIAQGGHFLSDVVASGFLVSGLSWLLYRAVVVHDGLGTLQRTLRHPSPALKRWGVLTIAIAVAFVASYLWLDRPIAIALRAVEPDVRPVMAIITLFGLGGPYIIASALAAVAARLAGRIETAWRAAYVFLAVAVSGLFADIVKPIAGRARPKLLFSEHLYGFTGVGAPADHWSFPSGHSVTAGALAVALSVLYPRLRPAWIAAALLVGFSRLALDQHYLSDVLGGLYIGAAFACAIAAAMEARGVALHRPTTRTTRASMAEPRRQ